MRIGITIGDGAGIGPEIIARALSDRAQGDSALSDSAQGEGNDDCRVYGARALFDDPAFEVVEVLGDLDFSNIEPGQPDPRCARLQLAALHAAIDDAKSGELDAIVTAPWTKSLFATIGEPPTGHTEVLARRFGVEQKHVMMLAGDVLRVALVTTHVPLSEVSALIDERRLLDTLAVTADELRRSWRIARPRIAVCGLDPHAGEQGHIGTIDRDIVLPTLARARRQLGVQIDGPFPADTLFVKFRGDEAPYDAVVAMYHDQGLVPLKLRHFGESANITLGLPVVRTSVDHGTAYDIAGKGIADASSLRYAIKLVREMVRNRRTV